MRERDQVKTQRIIALAALASVITVSVLASPAQAAKDELTAKDRAFLSYVQAHPEDYAGQDSLAQKLFGSRVYVSFDGEAEVTGDIASRKIQEANRTAAGDILALAPAGSLPTDIFTISISRSAISSGMWVGGHTNFRSDWAGQAAPHDVGTLQFQTPACVTLNNHSITTSAGNGAITNLGYLYDAKVTAKSPVFKVNDYMNGFVMQAKNVTASVVLKKSGCSGAQLISAAWKYEANQGGSIGTISAGWGFLSISYGGSTLKLQKSSSVINFSY